MNGQKIWFCNSFARSAYLGGASSIYSSHNKITRKKKYFLLKYFNIIQVKMQLAEKMSVCHMVYKIIMAFLNDILGWMFAIIVAILVSVVIQVLSELPSLNILSFRVL